MKCPLTILAIVIGIALSGCGEPRRFGDPNGIPVTVKAKVERAFFSSMENRQGRPSVGAGGGFSSGGSSSIGVGVGLHFSSTQVYLLGGDAVGQGNVFRQEVKWGDNSFTVPLTAGRTLHLMVQAEGGRRGWESLGSITVPAKDPTVTLVLDGNGTTLNVTPAATPAPVAPAPTPVANDPAPATPAQPTPSTPPTTTGP
jgi:hypothetical protein